MSTNRDVERIVRSWMDEGVTALPDRVLDLVLDQLPATPQRRSSWLARRFPIMNTKAFRYVVVAAAVIIVMGVAIKILPGRGVGGPGPTTNPSPTALAASDRGKPLAGGRYEFQAGRADEARFDLELTLKAGWVTQQFSENEVTFSSPASGRTYLSFFSVQRVYRDPCHPEVGYAGSYIGTTQASDLTDELRTLVGFDAGPASPWSIGGLSATHFVISNAINTDTAGCTDGGLLPLFITWLADKQAELAARTEHSPATNGGTEQEVWVVVRPATVIDGRLTGPDALLIIGEVDQATAAADRASLEDVIASVDFH